MKTPEIRVTRRGKLGTRVEWDPCREGQKPIDLTPLRVRRVERSIEICGDPETQVTFAARLVEVEEDG